VDIKPQAACSGRVGNLIGGYSWRHSTLPAAADRLHRQIFTADITVNWRGDIGLRAKWGTVIRKNPTHHATHYPAGGGFHWLVQKPAGRGWPAG